MVSIFVSDTTNLRMNKNHGMRPPSSTSSMRSLENEGWGWSIKVPSTEEMVTDNKPGNRGPYDPREGGSAYGRRRNPFVEEIPSPEIGDWEEHIDSRRPDQHIQEVERGIREQTEAACVREVDVSDGSFQSDSWWNEVQTARDVPSEDWDWNGNTLEVASSHDIAARWVFMHQSYWWGWCFDVDALEFRYGQY